MSLDKKIKVLNLFFFCNLFSGFRKSDFIIQSTFNKIFYKIFILKQKSVRPSVGNTFCCTIKSNKQLFVLHNPKININRKSTRGSRNIDFKDHPDFSIWAKNEFSPLSKSGLFFSPWYILCICNRGRPIWSI